MQFFKNNLYVIIVIFISVLMITIFIINTDAIHSLIVRGQRPALQLNTFTPPTPVPSATPTPSLTPVPRPTQVTNSDNNKPTPQVSSGSGSGSNPSPALSGCSQEDIQKLVDSVSEDNLRTNLENFAGSSVSRYIKQPGNQEKAEVVKQYFESVGLATSFQEFQANGATVNNVIADLPGQNTNDVFVVGAHIDSISGPKAPAPGADDNGSGTVVMMEAARVLKFFSQCLKTSIQFVGFNAEEVGLIGSRYYVENVGDKTVKGNFTMDMVGYSTDADCVDFNYKTSTNSEAISSKMVDVIAKYNIGMQGRARVFSAPSDNESFTNAGLPAVSLHECVHNQSLHTLQDTVDLINYSQVTKTTKAIVAAIAELASQ